MQDQGGSKALLFLLRKLLEHLFFRKIPDLHIEANLQVPNASIIEEVHDERVRDLAQNRLLRFDVLDLFQSDDFTLFQHLQCEVLLFPVSFIRNNAHTAKGTRTQRVTQLKKLHRQLLGIKVFPRVQDVQNIVLVSALTGL